MTLHRAPLPPLQPRGFNLRIHGAISAWLRHSPGNGKLLFSMDLAQLEAGSKEAQRSGSNLVLWLRRRSKRKAASANLVSLKTNHATTFGGASS